MTEKLASWSVCLKKPSCLFQRRRWSVSWNRANTNRDCSWLRTRASGHSCHTCVKSTLTEHECSVVSQRKKHVFDSSMKPHASSLMVKLTQARPGNCNTSTGCWSQAEIFILFVKIIVHYWLYFNDQKQVTMNTDRLSVILGGAVFFKQCKNLPLSLVNTLEIKTSSWNKAFPHSVPCAML